MHPQTPDAALPAHWLAALDRPGVADGLEAIYAEAAAAIAARGPACWASGRCCNFEKTGHRLYVTGLEVAYTIARAAPVASEAPASTSLPVLSLADVSEARARGGCPYQRGNLCGVHAVKPLACRTYFCDRTAQVWQHDLTERLLDRLRALHDAHGIEYRYAEWRAMLEMFAEQAPGPGARPRGIP